VGARAVAGRDPSLTGRRAAALDAQAPEDLLWIRDAFLDHPHPFPVTVVHGHTPAEGVHFVLPYRIGLDTGIACGGPLSALDCTSGTVTKVPRYGRQATVFQVPGRIRSFLHAAIGLTGQTHEVRVHRQ